MLRKSLLAIMTLFMLSSPLFAELCPSVNDIKNNRLNGWQAFNKLNGKQLSVTQMKKFRNKLDSFMLAEWMQNAPEGSGHCYYSGKSLQVFLAKQRLAPRSAMSKTNHWHKAGSAEVMQCNSPKIKECLFQAY